MIWPYAALSTTFVRDVMEIFKVPIRSRFTLRMGDIRKDTLGVDREWIPRRYPLDWMTGWLTCSIRKKCSIAIFNWSLLLIEPIAWVLHDFNRTLGGHPLRIIKVIIFIISDVERYDHLPFALCEVPWQVLIVSCLTGALIIWFLADWLLFVNSEARSLWERMHLRLN